MELFSQLFGDVLAFLYHCFDGIVIYGYLSGLSRPEQVVHFFRNVVGVAAVSKEVLSRRKPRTGALGIACTQADTPSSAPAWRPGLGPPGRSTAFRSSALCCPSV
jgi:hypothetical protein